MMQPDPSLFTNETMWLDTCDDDTDCEYPTPWCLNTGVDGLDGFCVANDTSLISNLTGLTDCTMDSDCPDTAPVCFNESTVSDITGDGYCVAACSEDHHCEDMGFGDAWCQDTGLPYDTCVTYNPCDVIGTSVDCNDDQVCINDMCMGSCEEDDV